jgi:hypothetical protein
LAGLLTRSVFDGLPVNRSVVSGHLFVKQVKFKNTFKSSQQRELSGIFTRFPFHSPPWRNHCDGKSIKNLIPPKNIVYLCFLSYKNQFIMKRLFLALAIIGMTGFAFGQQQQSSSSTSSANTKDAKCSKSCMKACGKNCKGGSCTHASATGTSTSKNSSSTTTTTTK